MTRWTYDPAAKFWPRIWWTSSRDLKTWSPLTWSEVWGIDPALFHDELSGKTYLNVMSPNNNIDRIWGLSQCEVDLVSGKCVDTFRSMWNGTLPSNSTARPEGPKMSWMNGHYYLFAAEGEPNVVRLLEARGLTEAVRGTDLQHRATIARSTSPQEPWDPNPSNPILYNGDPKNGNLTVQSTGHGTLVDTPSGDAYIVYLARRNIKGASPLGRESFISAVTWTSDGWPVVNDGKPVLLSDEVPGLPRPRTEKYPKVKEESFRGQQLSLEWYNLRTPYTPIYSLGKTPHSACNGKPGSGIKLEPNVFSLSDRDVPAALLRKQKCLNMTFSAQTFTWPAHGLGWRQTLGISAYLSELAHHDIGISTCRNATETPCVYTSIWRNGTEQYTEVPVSVGNDTAVSFTIRAEPTRYRLGYALSGPGGEQLDETIWLTEFESRWMAWAPTGYLVFEGAMFALFASGNGLPWTTAGPTVGFCSVQETFFEERIPDYDEGWES